MDIEEFQDWCEMSGWNFWSKINTVEEAMRDPNTVALRLITQPQGKEYRVGKAPINLRPHTLQPRM